MGLDEHVKANAVHVEPVQKVVHRLVEGLGLGVGRGHLEHRRLVYGTSDSRVQQLGAGGELPAHLGHSLGHGLDDGRVPAFDVLERRHESNKKEISINCY